MDEYLDVLDSEGNFTGQKKLRKELHKDENWHKVVFVWIMNPQGELLMQKRSLKKDAAAGKWDIACGGHVATGESSLATALKEAEEELGIHIQEKSLEFLFSVKELQESNNNKIHKCHTDVFLFRSDIKLSEIKLQEEEVDEIKYLPWKEVEEIISREDGTFAVRPNQYREFFKLLHTKI